MDLLSSTCNIEGFIFLGTDGVGTMEYTSGDVYHGQWYMGDMHGQVMSNKFF